MIEDNDKKTGHIYDGIEELDHSPPSWFTVLFLSTVAFGGLYFFYYTLGSGPTGVEEYRKARDAEEYARYEREAKSTPSKPLSEGELRALATDSIRSEAGGQSFQVKCASCHGAKGQGGIGPNLTDDYWIHGGKMTEVLTTITQGVPDKGMPSWGPVLAAREIQSLTAYIRTLRGTRPDGAKAPQGDRVNPEL